MSRFASGLQEQGQRDSADEGSGGARSGLRSARARLCTPRVTPEVSMKLVLVPTRKSIPFVAAVAGFAVLSAANPPVPPAPTPPREPPAPRSSAAAT